MSSTDPVLSAIVSTYNAERFMRGLLEDLEAQTIADRLEIVVVDSGSTQNERAIVEEFQQRYNNIVYHRTAERESPTAAVNRGIRIARGRYITIANTDDRHRSDGLETMVRVLEAKPDVTLVYANVHITETENETFEKHTRTGDYRWADFDPIRLLFGCYIGPQPLWRRNVHERYGYFDEALQSACDWEFWLRIAETEKFFHIDQFLGLYLKSPSSFEHRNQELSTREAKAVHERYISRLPKLALENGITTLSGSTIVGTSGRARKVIAALMVAGSGDASRALESLASNTEHLLAVTVVGGEPSAPLNGGKGWHIERSSEPTARALNETISKSHRAPVLLLSSDLVATPDLIDRMIEALERDPRLAAVGPVSNRAPRHQQVKAKYATTGKELVRFARGRAHHQDGQVAEVPYLGGFCLLLNPTVCAQVGNLREDVGLAAALWDYFGRVRQAGFELGVALDAYVHHERLTEEEGAQFDDMAAREEIVELALSRAQQSLEAGNLSEAAIEFARAAEVLPNIADPHAALGSTLMALGRFREAVESLRRAVSLSPDSADLRLQLGVALYQDGNSMEAEVAFRRAQEAAPEDVRPLLNLAELYRSRDDFEKASASVRDAVRLDPGNLEVLIAFGALSAELGDLEGARMALRRLEELHPDSADYEGLKEWIAAGVTE